MKLIAILSAVYNQDRSKVYLGDDNGNLLFKSRKDMLWFKSTTNFSLVIMGRKTVEGIIGCALADFDKTKSILPHRHILVLTTQVDSIEIHDHFSLVNPQSAAFEFGCDSFFEKYKNEWAEKFSLCYTNTDFKLNFDKIYIAGGCEVYKSFFNTVGVDEILLTEFCSGIYCDKQSEIVIQEVIKDDSNLISLDSYYLKMYEHGNYLDAFYDDVEICCGEYSGQKIKVFAVITRLK